MFRSKYSNFLTVVLIITIIAIIVTCTILVTNAYKKYKSRREAENVISDFNNNVGNVVSNSTGENFIEQNIIEEPSNTTDQNPSGNGTRRVTYYPNTNFVMIGYIEIPTINISLPIIEKETVQSLEKSVAVRYPDNPQLNQPGNIVIVGHNYRNGQFFSNLKKVAVGDKIRIKDTSGQILVYTVYEKYETTPEDTDYITRKTDGNTEITLVTCTNDNKARTIVKAKV